MIRRPPRSTRTDTPFPNTPPFRSPVADPPYEHGGPAGSGGGAGGGIVISGTRVDLSGATVRARGGNGGSGTTGAGGGGAGGVVKVVAPIQSGVSPDVGAGLSGDPAQLCTDVQNGRAQSELQSLMRISSAVFCLKKKKQTYEEYVSHNKHSINERIH